MKEIECTKCKCRKCMHEEEITIRVGAGHFYIDGDMAVRNNIRISRDGKDISDKCVGVIALEPKLFGGEDSFWEDKKKDV